MALLRGVGSLRPRRAASGASKARRRSVEDSPGRAGVVTVSTTKATPLVLAARPQQKVLKVGPSSSSGEYGQASPEEEASMINSWKLPLSCKELASASVQFAPFGFHRELQWSSL